MLFDQVLVLDPTNEDAKAQEALCKYLASNKLFPTVTINRGHSYNAPYTIEQMFSTSKQRHGRTRRRAQCHRAGICDREKDFCHGSLRARPGPRRTLQRRGAFQQRRHRHSVGTCCSKNRKYALTLILQYLGSPFQSRKTDHSNIRRT